MRSLKLREKTEEYGKKRKSTGKNGRVREKTEEYGKKLTILSLLCDALLRCAASAHAQDGGGSSGNAASISRLLRRTLLKDRQRGAIEERNHVICRAYMNIYYCT